MDDTCPLGPLALRDIPHAPDMTPVPSSLAIQIVDSGCPITMIFPVEVDAPDAATASDTTDIPLGDLDTTVVGFNTHCIDIPSSEEIGDDGETGDGMQTRDGADPELVRRSAMMQLSKTSAINESSDAQRVLLKLRLGRTSNSSKDAECC